MRQLSKIQSVIYILGGILMVIGAASFAFYMPGFQSVGDGKKLVEFTSWLFLLGTVLFSVLQAMQLYEGKNFIIIRLKRIQNVANFFFVLAGISMVDTVYSFALRWFENPMVYYSFIKGKWIVLMLIAAVLEIYTTHRISHELKKEECK